MFALAKSLLVLGRYLRRIALALESMNELYALELAERGIYRPRPSGGKADEVEISYEVRHGGNTEEWP